MKKVALLILLAALVVPAMAIETITFTAADIKDAMGISLHDTSNQWGLWAVRAMPIVNGGYTIVSGYSDQPGWGVYAPNGAFGASPYTSTNSVWFWDASGAEAGFPANPLYMIMDQPAEAFTSYFGNTVTAVDDNKKLSFSFTLDTGATWDGCWQFVVDGSKYTLGTSNAPGVWVADFFGGYGDGGGLAGNMGSGYKVCPIPAPAAIVLGMMGTGLVGWLRRRRSL